MDFFATPIANPNATHETVKPRTGSESLYVYHTPAGVFSSTKQAMEANNCSSHALTSRCKRASFPDWTRVPKDGVADYLTVFCSTMQATAATRKDRDSDINGKPVMTPNGPYPSLSAVVRASGYPRHRVRHWLKKWPTHYYYIKQKDSK